MQIFGRLDAFFETGTEGVVWSVADQRLPGYDGLWPLQFGDHLDVLDANGETLWQGIIKLEYDNRRVALHNQQEVLGYWVHGLQDGADPEDLGQAVLRSGTRHPYAHVTDRGSHSAAPVLGTIGDAGGSFA